MCRFGMACLLALTAWCAFGEDPEDCVLTFGVGTGYGTMEDVGWVPVTMDVPETPCSAPAAVTLQVQFNSSKLVYEDAGLGGGVCDAKKSLTVSDDESGTLTMVVFGVNDTAMKTGNLVWLGFKALEGVLENESVPVRLSDVSAASGDSDALTCVANETPGSFVVAATPDGVVQGPECDPAPLEGAPSEGASVEGSAAEGDIGGLEGDVAVEGDDGGGSTTDTSGCAGLLGGLDSPGSGGGGTGIVLVLAGLAAACCGVRMYAKRGVAG